MKVMVKDPVEAARRFGGATWEPGVGWWTFTTSQSDGMSMVRGHVRDAIYVPTRQKGGETLESSVVSCDA
jgi:hypothetical protein